MTDQERYEAQLNSRYIPISEEFADVLMYKAAWIFDCSYFNEDGSYADSSYGGCHGFFEAIDSLYSDLIVICRSEGYYLRFRNELVSSNDDVFHSFIEDGLPPEFEDVFEVTKL